MKENLTFLSLLAVERLEEAVNTESDSVSSLEISSYALMYCSSLSRSDSIMVTIP